MPDQQQKTIGRLKDRRRAYQLALSSPAGQEVLADLAIFCRANETCFHPDARLHAVAEGRREVWLRIQSHLNLSLEDLYTMLGGKTLHPAAFQGDDE